MLSSIAQVILAEFGAYYNDFMPLMLEILEKVGQASMAEKSLRAKTIDTIGSIIIAVTDADDRDQFKDSVMNVADYLTKLI